MFRVIRQSTRVAAITLALVGCSGVSQAPTATPEVVPLYFVTDSATGPLLQELSASYQAENDLVAVVDQSRSGYRVQDLLNDPNNPSSMPYAITTRYPESDQFWAAPLGYEAITIITHPQNNIARLTAQDLRRIFSGNVQSWSSFGGNDLPIVVVSRENTAAITQSFRSIVMGNREIALSARLATTPTTMMDIIAQTPGAIGFIEHSMVNNRVNIIPVAEYESSPAIAPNASTIANGYYPLQTPVLIIGRHPPQPNDNYYEFILWVQQGEGRRIISNYYVPLALAGDLIN